MTGRPDRATSGLPRLTGIVLAGGRSTRFGSDKLAATLGERTLLERSCAAVAAIASEVVVVLAPDDDRALPSIAGRTIRVAHDARPGEGPLAGLLAGLEVAAEPLAIVVGGDMPTLDAAVLAILARAIAADQASVDAVVLAQRGETRPLPMAIRTGSATVAARRLLGDGERRLRALPEAIPSRQIDEADWRPLDPDARTLLDVDLPEDLADADPRT